MSGVLRLIAGVALTFACACELWRSRSPQVDDDFPIVLPKIAQAELPSGLLVVATRNATAGVVRMSIVMRAGYGHDPAGREGRARFLATALALMSTSETNDARFGLLGATPSFDVTHSGLEIAIETLPEDARAGAAALAGFIADVEIGPEVVERARAIRKAELDGVRGSPTSLAALALAQAYSPFAGRFTGLGLGTPASIAASDAADLQEHLAKARNTRETAFIVTGLVDPKDVGTWTASAFAGWPAAPESLPLGAGRVARRSAATLFIPMKGMAQALIVVGGLRPHSRESEILAYEVALGRVVARWNYVLRSEKRMTYGVSSEVVSERDAFAISTRVRPDGVRVALRMLDEAIDMAANAPWPDGVRWSRISRSSEIMYAAQDADRVAAGVVADFLRGEREFSLRADLDAVAELDEDAVTTAAREYLDLSALQVIVVGDRDSVLPQLGADTVVWTPPQLINGELP